ncbi:uncharacterized protein DUF397 [Streptomyces sp. 1114.5]|nr:DUF397 domain-containing protein [Streptomyces sp. 1114.5]RKT15989.1 uncharacterized protein DUF397 [Streptomyces sp. 1114.5]
MRAADLGNVLWQKSSYSGQGGDCVEVAGLVSVPAFGNWRKSFHSGAQSNCVEVADPLPIPAAGLNWRTSSFSGAQSECVEVAGGVTDVVPVRDSKDPEGPALLFPVEAWSSFLAGVKGGEFSA